MIWTRRRFNAAFGAGALATVFAACTRQTPLLDPVSTTRAGATFTQPAILMSNNGLLEVTLRAEAGDVSWNGRTRYSYTYNGMSPGPTLHLRPGDRLVVHLENELDDDTNLHTHGLHVSPAGDSDNVFVRVRPGQSRTYTYDLPANHRSGTFWYHPHAHGNVAKQVAAGLAGAIVVVDYLDDIPEIAASSERVWILADPPIGDGADVLNAGQMDLMAGREGGTILVNGIERPEVEVEAGTIERWRLLNASASRYYRLALEGHPFHVIASDGGRLRAPATVEEILLAPGERAEVLVTPSRAGSFSLRTLRYDRGNMGMAGMMGGGSLVGDEAVLATLTVTGRSEPAQMPESLVDANDFALAVPVRSRVLELGMGMGGGMMSFTIDGQTFDPDRTDISPTPGTVENWEIVNTTPMDHPLHLHVWPFLLMDERADAGWKDTVNIPADESVSVLVPFDGMTGRTVYHCHILDHEDLGMMGVIEVSD